MIDIGKKIKELRIERGMLQKDLATKIGVARNTITQYEQNIAKPSYEVLIEIAKIFNVSTDYLLGLEDESGRKTYINNYGKINNISNNNFNNSGDINF